MDGRGADENLKYCLVGRALKEYNSVASSKKTMAEMTAHIRKACSKPTELYLNKFYSILQEPGESVAKYCLSIQTLLDKGLPGLEKTHREQMLKARLITVVPENVKNFLELLGDRSWDELVAIFEKQTDYRLVVPPPTHLITADANRIVTTDRRTPEHRRFIGSCHYCGKPGHKYAECRNRARSNPYQTRRVETPRSANSTQERTSFEPSERNDERARRVVFRSPERDNERYTRRVMFRSPDRNDDHQNKRRSSVDSNRHAFAIDVIDDNSSEVNQKSIECHSIKSELKFKHKLTRVECEVEIGNRADVTRLWRCGTTKTDTSGDRGEREVGIRHRNNGFGRAQHRYGQREADKTASISTSASGTRGNW